MGSYNSELVNMALWGKIPSAFVRYRCSGSPVRWLREPPIRGGGDQESRQEFGFKLRLYGKAAICGMTAWIFVGFDTLQSSGKRFDFLLKGNHKATPFFFSKTHGWHFEIEISLCTNTRNLAITDYDEHVASNVKTKQVEVWDIVFLSVKGANLKNKPAVCRKYLHIFTQRFHSLPLVNSWRRPSA